MKLVGATNWFVRGPFMLEGLICGLDRLRSRRCMLLLLGKEIVLPLIDDEVGLADRRRGARVRPERAGADRASACSSAPSAPA